MKSPAKYVMLGMIRLYQILLSPLVNFRGQVCKYYPTCSHYGYDAVETHGACKGGALTVWRVLRCNPWSGGGYDPVPPKKSRGVRNHSEVETSSPDGDTQQNTLRDTAQDTQTSDPVLAVGSPPARVNTAPTAPDRPTAGPDLTSLRGA